MGSSTSKPRKGHEHPKHLPKVGTPENLEHRLAAERQATFGVFGSKWAIVIAVMLVLSLIGWLALSA